MSDLQCPATVLVARHGHAACSTPALLTDDGGWLTEVGLAQVTALADRLAADPAISVAAVYASPLARCVQSGRQAGRLLEVPHEVMPGLEEHSVGDLAGQSQGDQRFRSVVDAWRHGRLDVVMPGGEDGHAVVQRFRAALQDIADQHRGQTVLAFSHSGVMAVALPWLCDNVRPDLAVGQVVPHAAPATVRIDADGWVLDDWPGHAVGRRR